jgi:predicted dehydrogenase
MTRLRFGLIGTGFIGRMHAIALHAVGAVFDDIEAPLCSWLADADADLARKAAAALRFEHATGDWRELVARPDVDVVDICTPNYLHYDMALAVLAVGKHVYCEKPLALTPEQADELATAAARAGVCHAIGFNFVRNPILRHARAIIEAGELGQVHGFAGRNLEDYMGDAAVPHSWRCERRLAGSGALADLGSHLINLAHFLIGDIARVQASLKTVHATRLPRGGSQSLPVENEDIALVLVEFASGATGSFNISRVATGYKSGLGFTITGTRGTLEFDQERMNELRFYTADDRSGRRGFRTILTGPEHPDYARFCPAPGHGLGINDLKILEIHELIRAIESRQPIWPDFAEGARVQKLMAAIEHSHATRAWVETPP